ncbi:unnamed protein product, partial [Symbiodinium pilosum]
QHATTFRCIGERIALSSRPWRTPLGTLEVDAELMRKFRALGYPVDERGHAQEHSIENQLPFLQHLAPDVRILPLGLSQLTLSEAEQLAKDIVTIIDRENILLIATTDYLHAGEGYYDQPPRGMHLHEFIRKRDAPVLAAIEKCSTTELIRASGQTGMCGLWPAVVVLTCAKLMRFTNCQLLKYAVSGEVFPAAGCTGFASWIFGLEDFPTAY